ncbi:hypothetical protein D9758_009006 [Tetrapyrgos nigripes]|uniref:Uncharacterized protein n=1 Tax=Tetrapyrgos nigripes TaxID=182062 RepID=A0A8H5GK94_9AGAR|nr:hypothetical protein D9758_009006 [Tetrapyrgos nigripes]
MPRSSSHSPAHTKIRPAKCSNSLPPRFANELNFNTLHNAAAAIAGSVKPETHCRQQQAVTEFAIWANDMGLHPDEVLPAPEAVLCEFAASFLGRLAGGTVKAKLSALKAWHTMLGFRWLRSDLLHKTLTGVDRQSPSSLHHPERPPVTRDMMRSLHAAWSTSNHGDHKCALSGSKCSLLGQLQLVWILETNSCGGQVLAARQRHSATVMMVEVEGLKWNNVEVSINSDLTTMKELWASA